MTTRPQQAKRPMSLSEINHSDPKRAQLVSLYALPDGDVRKLAESRGHFWPLTWTDWMIARRLVAEGAL